MNHGRVYGNQQSLEGKTVGTLEVQAPVSIHPKLRYNTVCTRCGAQAEMPHEKLRSPTVRCQNSGCGREGLQAELDETLGKYRARETAGERGRAEERERAERERLEKAEAAMKRTADEVARTVRERVVTQRDDELFVSPALVNARMSQDEAAAFNRAEVEKFVRDNPRFAPYKGESTLDAIAGYFERNSIRIADSEMIAHAFQRLLDCGLLTKNAPPAPIPAPRIPKPEPAPKPVSTPILPDGSEEGWEPTTGLRRVYTKVEIAAMSADAFRRAFRVPRADFRPI